MLAKEYKIDKKLGSGAFAKVISATHKATGLKRAIKIMKKEGTSKKE